MPPNDSRETFDFPVQNLKLEPKYIAVEGVIGVGKTTLARMLGDRWKSKTFFEVFEDNPFLTKGFYEDSETYGFNTEIFFLLSRFRQQREIQNENGFIVSDYFFEKNWIFAQHNLKKEDLSIYKTAYDGMLSHVRKPDLIVFLQADLETLLRRIYFRDRQFERSLTPAYLEQLMNEYYRFFTAFDKVPVISISTNGMDFVHDASDFLKVAHLIEDRLKGQVQLPLKTQRPSESVKEAYV